MSETCIIIGVLIIAVAMIGIALADTVAAYRHYNKRGGKKR